MYLKVVKWNTLKKDKNFNIYQNWQSIARKHTPPHSTPNSPLFSELFHFLQQMETSVDISWQRTVADSFGCQELQFPRCPVCCRGVAVENCGNKCATICFWVKQEISCERGKEM